MEEIKAFYCIIYDLPSEERIPEIREKKEEELTPKEKKVLNEQRIKVDLRQKIQWEVNKIATYINKSVYLLDRENLNKAKQLISKFQNEYKNKLDIIPEIYILQFSPTSTETLKQKALKSLENRLNKLLDQMDRLDNELSKRKRNIRPSEKKKIIDTLQNIDNLAKQFNIKKKLENLLIICDEKLKDL